MSLHILVVDDEPDVEVLIRQRFRRQIRAEQFAFNFARDGVEALEVLADNPSIEVVLSDINMPRMDGLTLLRHIAELDRLLKVVIVSAYGDLENIRTAMNRGAFDFITKPIDFADLDLTIEKTNQEVAALRRAMVSQNELTSIRRELDIAREIQLSFVPLEISGTYPGIDVHGMTKPAHEVGGDFYDFFAMGRGRYGFAIGDVAGKGLGAALFMAVTRTMLRATALSQQEPSTVMRHVNGVLAEDAPSRMFVTCIFGIFDTESGTVTWANAGHNPPVLRRADGHASMLRDARGPALCLMSDAQYRDNVLQLDVASTLLLYTDGVTEAVAPAGGRFEDERLIAAAGGQARPGIPSLVEEVMAQVMAFADTNQSDDITLLSFGATEILEPVDGTDDGSSARQNA
jgi:phosphoserine phosphatase RsbU/P